MAINCSLNYGFRNACTVQLRIAQATVQLIDFACSIISVLDQLADCAIDSQPGVFKNILQ